jgi:ferredoxin--NADP+ reductase
MVADLPALAAAPDRSPDSLSCLLAERGVKVVTWDGWLAIDRLERSLGETEGRSRAKLPTRELMVKAARNGLQGSDSSQ